MAWTQIDAAFGIGASGTVTATFVTPANAGELLVAFVQDNNGASHDCAISGWTIARTEPINTTAANLVCFYKIAAGGETSATATATNGGNMHMQLFRYTGNATSSPLDTQNGANDGATSGTTVVTGTITTTDAGDLIMVGAAQNTTNGGSTSWATATLQNAGVTNKLIVGQYIPGSIVTTFQDTASWATSRTKAGVIVAFKPAVTTSPSGLLAFT